MNENSYRAHVICDFPVPFLKRELGSNFVVSNLEEFFVSQINPTAGLFIFLISTKTLAADSVLDGISKRILSLPSSKVVVRLLPSDVSVSFDERLQADGNLNELRKRARVAAVDLRIILEDEIVRDMDGEAIFDSRVLFSTGCAYSFSFQRLLASSSRAMLDSLAGNSIRLIILDLDNTLWGGVLSESSRAEIDLGGHSPIGEAFQHVQRELQSARQSGILLAIASKNDQTSTLDFIQTHPEMILRANSFAAIEISFEDKTKHIAKLLADTGVAEKFALFIDDNPHERDLVRSCFPNLQVPTPPQDPLHWPNFIRQLTQYLAFFKSAEDLKRNDSLSVSKKRDALKIEKNGSLENWLTDLQAEVVFAPVDQDSILRATQLLNKTSQFNTSPRRTSIPELSEWLDKKNHHLYTVSYQDRLGADGIIGLVGFSQIEEKIHVHDFLLSCRVIGRHIERAMIDFVFSRTTNEFISVDYNPDLRGDAIRSFINELDRLATVSSDTSGLIQLKRLSHRLPHHLSSRCKVPDEN